MATKGRIQEISEEEKEIWFLAYKQLRKDIRLATLKQKETLLKKLDK